jgi:hypothetical protein
MIVFDEIKNIINKFEKYINLLFFDDYKYD